jgi:phosphatidylserine/phosphatidylglycerophosphate/cardiolipin synthase-like enzyme
MFAISHHIVARLARYPRFLLGRFHRRRPHRHTRQVRKRKQGEKNPPGRWWSGDDRWFEGGFAPCRRNTLTPLIDGKEAFEAMLEAIKGAQHYVYIVGWALTPAFSLDRTDEPPSPEGLLADVLAKVSERVPVKILVWQGSTMLFQPSKKMTKQAREELLREAPRIDVRLDGTARPTHCHHQKVMVVDGQVGFVGGLDLTTLEGDRWDTPGHPLRFGRGWHDVALRVEGDAVADLERNFAQRWGEVTKERDLPHRNPEIDPGWQTPCQVVRTIPKRTYRFARKGEFGIAAAYRDAIARANDFIYLENQYFWAPEVVEALAEAMERNKDRRFRIVLVIPARADFGKYDNDKQVEYLREVDNGRGMFHAFSLYSGGPASGPFGFGFVPIYVHAKVAIVDDEWYMVGSANINRRGLAKDGELNVQAIDRVGARKLRLRLWAEHLRADEDELVDADPVELVDRLWVPRSAEVEKLVKQKRGILPALIHPYQTGNMPGMWILQELQSLAEGV